MATVPVDELKIIEKFGPHLSAMSGVQLSTSVEPDQLVKTHCCFCGQQCGIQLKVRDNQVIGFEPWEDFPFNRGMLTFVLMLVVLQLWLLTATMNAYLGGDQSVIWPAAGASVACLLLNGGLLRYLYHIDRARQ